MHIQLRLFGDDRRQLVHPVAIGNSAIQTIEQAGVSRATSLHVRHVGPRGLRPLERWPDVRLVGGQQPVGRAVHDLVRVSEQSRRQLGNPGRERLHAQRSSNDHRDPFLQHHPDEPADRRPHRKAEKPPAHRSPRPREPHMNEHAQQRPDTAVDMELEPTLRGTERPGEQPPPQRVQTVEQEHHAGNRPERQSSPSSRPPRSPPSPHTVNGDRQHHQHR